MSDENTTTKKSKAPLYALLLICLFAFWLRLPKIGEGMPFFYNEDEAHHFNRTVNMTKSGDWDPRYFHKPSLHFYLRIPVVAASFIDAVRKGHLRSLKEIKTRNSYGLAGYAFTASHVGIVKWNRAFSVLLSILIIIFAYLVTKHITDSEGAALLAALLSAVSPDLMQHSATVGVDILMSLMCVIAVYLGLKLVDSFSIAGLIFCGIIAGLAVSSKYNALPIAVLPIFICLQNKRFSVLEIFLALLTPALGFLLGSPYVLSSFALFLDQLAYEIWHYGVAGHVGHSAEPGLAQASFYLGWLSSSAVGYVAIIACLVGLFALFKGSKKASFTFLCFPVLFAILMLSQKANFTRNMLVIIPFAASLAAWGLMHISKSWPKWIFTLLSLVVIAQPLYSAIKQRNEVHAIADSRYEAATWLRQEALKLKDTAVAGQILFPPALYEERGLSSFNQLTQHPIGLYLAGYKHVVYGNDDEAKTAWKKDLKLIQSFAGAKGKQRIVKNPQVEVYTLGAESEGFSMQALEYVLKSDDYYNINFDVNSTDPKACSSSYPHQKEEQGSENYCWLQSKISKLKLNLTQLPNSAIKSGKINLSFSAMSPWNNQSLTFAIGDWKQEFALKDDMRGKWQSFSVDLPIKELKKAAEILVFIPEVHAPKAMGLSADTRRLGVALKGFVF